MFLNGCIDIWTLGVLEHSRNTSKNRLRLKKELDHKQQSDFLASAHPTAPPAADPDWGTKRQSPCLHPAGNRAEVFKERTRNQELRWGQAVETQRDDSGGQRTFLNEQRNKELAHCSQLETLGKLRMHIAPLMMMLVSTLMIMMVALVVVVSTLVCWFMLIAAPPMGLLTHQASPAANPVHNLSWTDWWKMLSFNEEPYWPNTTVLKSFTFSFGEQ